MQIETTLFLAQLWGPVLILIGVGIWVSSGFYHKLYKDLEKETLAVLSFGILATIAGLAHVLVHNYWDNNLEILISLLGWATLIKGAAFLVWPHLIDLGGNWAAKHKTYRYSSVVMIILGLYLFQVSYF